MSISDGEKWRLLQAEKMLDDFEQTFGQPARTTEELMAFLAEKDPDAYKGPEMDEWARRHPEVLQRIEAAARRKRGD
jgi:hypothetical protein